MPRAGGGQERPAPSMTRPWVSERKRAATGAPATP